MQRLTTLQLDQMSELVELIDRVKQKKIHLAEASHRSIASWPSTAFQFSDGNLWIFLVLHWADHAFPARSARLLITGATGILVGLMVLWFQKQPRFNLLLPVIAAIVVSTLIFNLTRLGYHLRSGQPAHPPLIMFLPGAAPDHRDDRTGLDAHPFRICPADLWRGSALIIVHRYCNRVKSFPGCPTTRCTHYEAVYFPGGRRSWAPCCLVIGTFIRLSGANRDLFWMLLVLYIAMLGQSIGEKYFNSYFGAFFGATLMALSSEFIARSPRRTPALVSQTLAFWFLVPGARGLLSVTSFLSEDLQSAAIGLGEMVILITDRTGSAVGHFDYLSAQVRPGHCRSAVSTIKTR